MVEYVPTLTEWKVTAGIWAFGLMVLTVAVAVKVALPVLSGQFADSPAEHAQAGHGDAAPESRQAA